MCRFKAIKENIEVILMARYADAGPDPAIKMAKREGRFEYNTGEIYEGWWDLGRVRPSTRPPSSPLFHYYPSSIIVPEWLHSSLPAPNRCLVLL